jgi:hypothetical protein
VMALVVCGGEVRVGDSVAVVAVPAAFEALGVV